MDHWSTGSQEGKNAVLKHKLATNVNLPITNPMSNITLTTTGLHFEQPATHNPGHRVASFGSLGGNDEASSLN